jgi:hypothetical protein
MKISDIVSTDKDAACPWKPDSLGVDVSNGTAAGAAGRFFYDSLYEQYASDWQVQGLYENTIQRCRRRDWKGLLYLC